MARAHVRNPETGEDLDISHVCIAIAHYALIIRSTHTHIPGGSFLLERDILQSISQQWEIIAQISSGWVSSTGTKYQATKARTADDRLKPFA